MIRRASQFLGCLRLTLLRLSTDCILDPLLHRHLHPRRNLRGFRNPGARVKVFFWKSLIYSPISGVRAFPPCMTAFITTDAHADKSAVLGIRGAWVRVLFWNSPSSRPHMAPLLFLPYTAALVATHAHTGKPPGLWLGENLDSFHLPAHTGRACCFYYVWLHLSPRTDTRTNLRGWRTEVRGR